MLTHICDSFISIFVITADARNYCRIYKQLLDGGCGLDLEMNKSSSEEDVGTRFNTDMLVDNRKETVPFFRDAKMTGK